MLSTNAKENYKLSSIKKEVCNSMIPTSADADDPSDTRLNFFSEAAEACGVYFYVPSAS